MASIFDTIKVNPEDTQKSYRWFQSQVKQLGSKVNQNNLMQNSRQMRNNILPGDMYLFYYDPKHKETLPYYDTFPLVLPFRRVQDGFYGINLHYMPYLMRFKLLKALSENATDTNYNQNTKIRISWRILVSFSSIASINGSVKHYLDNHVKSRFLKINYPDWITASQLPIEQFEKASKTKVWREASNR